MKDLDYVVMCVVMVDVHGDDGDRGGCDGRHAADDDDDAESDQR